MKGNSSQTLFRFAVILFVSLASALLSYAQSQALNAQVEGTVTDTNDAPIAGCVVTVTNIETGALRAATTDERGVFRLPLLPLGTSRLVAEAKGFKTLVREGIILTAGQTATVDLALQAGDVREVVDVTSDAAIVDAGKTDVGRVMSSREVQNLPLVSRNPYIFGLLQPNVTGRPNRGSNFPDLHANGYARRVNYQLDGNTATQADRAGVRLLQVSDTFVSEVQLVSNGFAAEFGNTPGLIMNVITPYGTNDLKGTIGYRLRRPSFYSRPFFFPAERLPDNKVDDLTATIGGPIIKDRLHFYFGYEHLDRDDKAVASRLTSYDPVQKARLIGAGLPASIFPPAIPVFENSAFYFARSDVQLNRHHRMSVRFNKTTGDLQNLITGGINTLEQSTNTLATEHSFGAQLVSFRSTLLSEFRFHYAHRKVAVTRNEFSGSGPSIAITRVANFGSPPGDDQISPLENVTELQENVTWTNGPHVVKAGGGVNLISNFERAGVFSQYTFATVNAYLAARNGSDRRSYQFFDETFGDPDTRVKANYWSLFVQDDWKVTARLKLNYGLRYDLYDIPKADPASPFPSSRSFHLDKNNIAPRFGIAYALRQGERPFVIRAAAGLYYEAPWLNMYQSALLNNGNPKFFRYRFAPNDPFAPAFPETVEGTLPPGLTLPRQSISTISPDFENMYAIHSNVQLEKAVTDHLSFSIGYVTSGGRHIPVYRNINPINPVRFLADGRGVFDPNVNAATRLDPRFNVIQTAESVGTSRYNALTFQFIGSNLRGFQFFSHYTLSRAVDDAPEQNVGYVSPNLLPNIVLSDPYNRRLDRGYSYADQRHSFALSLIASPTFHAGNKSLRSLLNNNQFGVFAYANSGERFNIVSNIDINRDGHFGPGIANADRPVGIARNAGKSPPQFDLDLRYSRVIDLPNRFRLEAFVEFTNLFNINSIVGYTDVTVPTDADGNLTEPLPDFRSLNKSVSQESRQVQLGLKFHF